MGNVIEYTLNEDRQGFIKPTLVKPKEKLKVICSREDWKRTDKEEALKEQCQKSFNNFFIRVRGMIKPRPKKDRPKISKLTKKIINRMVLQDA